MKTKTQLLMLTILGNLALGGIFLSLSEYRAAKQESSNLAASAGLYQKTLRSAPRLRPAIFVSPRPHAGRVIGGNQRRVGVGLLGWCTPRMPCILPAHRPRAFGEAFGIGLDGIELFVP